MNKSREEAGNRESNNFSSEEELEYSETDEDAGLYELNEHYKRQLRIAIDKSDVAKIEELKAKLDFNGITLDAGDWGYYPPTEFAIMFGNSDTIGCLIEGDAINQTGYSSGYTPLGFAVQMLYSN